MLRESLHPGLITRNAGAKQRQATDQRPRQANGRPNKTDQARSTNHQIKQALENTEWAWGESKIWVVTPCR
jgi:hypothetical protein